MVPKIPKPQNPKVRFNMYVLFGNLILLLFLLFSSEFLFQTCSNDNLTVTLAIERFAEQRGVYMSISLLPSAEFWSWFMSIFAWPMRVSWTKSFWAPAQISRIRRLCLINFKVFLADLSVGNYSLVHSIDMSSRSALSTPELIKTSFCSEKIIGAFTLSRA